MNGADVRFITSPEPYKKRGTSPKDAPYSLSLEKQ